MSPQTGSVKSFTFQIAPYAWDFFLINSDTPVEDIGSVCLVVVHLLVLVNDRFE